MYRSFEHPKVNTCFVISLFVGEIETPFFVYKLFMVVHKLGISILDCGVGEFGTLLGILWQNCSNFALRHPKFASH